MALAEDESFWEESARNAREVIELRAKVERLQAQVAELEAFNRAAYAEISRLIGLNENNRHLNYWRDRAQVAEQVIARLHTMAEKLETGKGGA